MEKIEWIVQRLYDKYKFAKDMIFTEEDKKRFNDSTVCHICGGELAVKRDVCCHVATRIKDSKCTMCGKPNIEDDTKVRDHCHITGKFRGAAHNGCNLNYKLPMFYSVILHNLSGYDAHLFIKNIGKTPGKITCIPNSEEKYISFSKHIVVDTCEKDGKKHTVKREIRFVDSYRFLASSLDSLFRNLVTSSKENLKNLTQFYKDEKQLSLLLRKGVFPYDW